MARGMFGSLADAALDLLLGGRCAGCGAPGRSLCATCWAGLPGQAALRWPRPTPPGLVPPYSAGEYAGTLRALVLAHKEEHRWSLVRPLGRLLAVAVAAAAPPPRSTHAAGPVVLVPVPSHPAVVRERGHEPVLALSRSAAAALRRRGVEATVSRAMRVTARPVDQAGLSSAERAANVSGRFATLGQVARVPPRGRVVLCDDVLTTGATLREAQRALEEAGVTVTAAATVAATRRRQGDDDPSEGYRPAPRRTSVRGTEWAPGADAPQC